MTGAGGMPEEVRVACFTPGGARLCAALCEALRREGIPARGFAAGAAGAAVPGLEPLAGGARGFAAAGFQSGKALVFIGAAGIAVRAVAPLLRGKELDPAVLVLDEKGRFAVPILSGHLGGANRLARHVAALTGAAPVLTTATDVNGLFAADTWAAENGCAVFDPREIKAVSAALLAGEPVGFLSDFPVEGEFPPGVAAAQGGGNGVFVSLRVGESPFAHTLHLTPRCVTVGIGCKKGVKAETLERRAREALGAAGLPLCAVRGVATLDRKAREPALRALCEKYRLPLFCYTARELAAVPGDFTASAFVRARVGVDNVCERAAAKAGGALVLRKTAGEGVTVAAAQADWRGSFENTHGGD